jgi:hypothetical protein
MKIYNGLTTNKFYAGVAMVRPCVLLCIYVSVSVCVCMCACMRTGVCVCVCVYVCAAMMAYVLAAAAGAAMGLQVPRRPSGRVGRRGDDQRSVHYPALPEPRPRL